MKTLVIGFSLLFFNFSANSQPWTQLGNTFNSPGFDPGLCSLDLNYDGSTLAIGEKGFDGNGVYSGRVIVYTYDSGSWIQKGSAFYGSISDQVGCDVKLCADGNTVIIGEPGIDDNGTQSGRTRVFLWNGTSWTQKGSSIVGTTDLELGTQVAISHYGTRIAMSGFPTWDTDGVDIEGRVRVYEWQNNDWSQMGTDFIGPGTDLLFDQYGESISLNSNGDVIAIACQSCNFLQGLVQVYEWNSGTWSQRGGDLIGLNNEQLGSDVALSNDGNTLIVGAEYYDNNGTSDDMGRVRVYNWNGSSWTLKGSVLEGTTGDQFGHSVDINNDGDIIAIGVPYADNSLTNNGYVQVFSWDGNNWASSSDQITGESNSANCGKHDLSLSKTGEKVGVISSGPQTTRVFGSPLVSIENLNSAPQLSIFPNPAQSKLNISPTTPQKELQILDNTGRVVIQQQLTGSMLETIQIESLSPGTYQVIFYSFDSISFRHTFIKS